MKKKTGIFPVLLLLLLVGGFLIIRQSFQPLPEEKRNLSTMDIRMQVDVPDTAGRTPIVRTFTREEFDKKDEKERERLKEVVNGNIEGDVPALVREKGRDFIALYFLKTDTSAPSDGALVSPDALPEIRLSVLETLYSREEPKVITDTVTETEEGKYRYEISGYLDETQRPEDSEMEAMYIQVRYQIDGTGYVSVFAINTLESR